MALAALPTMNKRGEQIEAGFHAAQDCVTLRSENATRRAGCERSPAASGSGGAVDVGGSRRCRLPTVQDAPPRVEFGKEVGRMIGATSCWRGLAKGHGGGVPGEQQEPVQRQVALKIIKLGMDTGRWSRGSRPSARRWP